MLHFMLVKVATRDKEKPNINFHMSRTTKYLIISAIIHAAVFLIDYSRIFNKNTQKAEVSVSIKEQRPAKPSANMSQKVGGKAPENTEKPIRIGMIDNEDTLDLGQKISASNYFEKLRAQVEPPWRRSINMFVGKTRPKCICNYLLSVDSHGRMKVISLQIASCNRQTLCNLTTEILLSTGYPIPPKDLLQTDVVEITWIFSIGI